MIDIAQASKQVVGYFIGFATVWHVTATDFEKAFDFVYLKWFRSKVYYRKTSPTNLLALRIESTYASLDRFDFLKLDPDESKNEN
jgi:hypothetical protein